MNTNNIPSEDRLKDLFREMPLDNPSVDFTRKLMIRIEKEAVKQKKVKQWNLVGWMLSGTIGIIGLPALVLYLIGFEIELPVFSQVFSDVATSTSSLQELKISPSVIMLGVTVLLLLIGDMIFRKTIENREKGRMHHA